MSCKNKRLIYGSAAVLVLLAEWLISKTSGFLRYTVGDLLVVIFLYAVIRIWFVNKPKPIWLASGVLIFAFCVELSQYFNLIGLLGLTGERMAHLTMGSTFDWLDMAAYAVGCAAAFAADELFRRKSK